MSSIHPQEELGGWWWSSQMAGSCLSWCLCWSFQLALKQCFPYLESHYKTCFCTIPHCFQQRFSNSFIAWIHSWSHCCV